MTRPVLSPEGPIVRAAELRVWTRAGALLSRAEAEAEAMREAARAEAEAGRAALKDEAARLARAAEAAKREAAAAGYRDGYQAGSAALAKSMAHTAAEATRYFKGLEAALPDLALAVLSRVLGEAEGDEAMVARAARHVLDGLDAASRKAGALVLRVPPDARDAVAAELADETARGLLSVAPDAELTRGQAVLWSPFGAMELSLDAQLARLREALGRTPAEETMPAEAVPQDAVPQDAVPQDAVPQETAPEGDPSA